MFFCPCPVGLANFDSRWHQILELHKVEVFEIHNCLECKNVAEKI
jgi:hypothetical protein